MNSSAHGWPAPEAVRAELRSRTEVLADELRTSLGDGYSRVVVEAAVAGAVDDLMGSVAPEALPEMATRLAVIRLTGRLEPIRIDHPDGGC